MQFLNGSLQTTKDIHLSILLQYGLIFFRKKKRNNNHAGVPKINKIKNGGNCAKKCIFYDTLFTVERPLLIETDMIVCLETLQSLTCFFFSSDESASERASVLATPPANAFCKFAIAMASHGHGSRASAFWTQWTESVKYPHQMCSTKPSMQWLISKLLNLFLLDSFSLLFCKNIHDLVK